MAYNLGTIKNKAKKTKKKKTDKAYLQTYSYDEILMLHRNVFLYGDINTERAFEINAQLLALGYLSNSPIVLWINSNGGSVDDGLSIVDTIELINKKAPVYTVVKGASCSMASIISVCGAKRFITKNATWMIHNIYGRTEGNPSLIDKQLEHIKHLNSLGETILSEKTKLPKTLREEANKTEVTLAPYDCLKYGVVDSVLEEL